MFSFFPMVEEDGQLHTLGLLEQLRDQCKDLWGTSSELYFRVEKLLSQLANPNLHDIPSNLQIHVELWDRYNSHVRWVIAATSTLRRSGCAQGDGGPACGTWWTVRSSGKSALASEGCTVVAMEATGVYWKPVWHVLSDGDFELVLANAKQVKNVPGRKTDVNDATWLADLLAHGLIRSSFVPDAPTQVLRNLLRTRKQLVRERSSHVQRLQKTLEDANIKLDSVVTDIIGMTGRVMLAALIAGETDPGKLAALADYRIKAPPARLREALRGRIMKHHRFLLRLHLQQIDAIDTAVAEIDREVNERIEPFRITVELLTTIPGIGELAARIIAAEIGNDMSRFATAASLGPVYAPEMTRALGSDALPACDTALLGSRPP